MADTLQFRTGGMLAGVLGLIFMGMVGAGAPASAESYYVDPTAKAGAADGSRDHPWPSVVKALKSGTVVGGDVLHLAPGEHGDIRLERLVFEAPVTLLSDPQDPAHFSYLHIKWVRNLVVDGVAIWPTEGSASTTGPLIEENGVNTVLRNLDIRGRADAPAYLDWTKDDWLTRQRGALRSKGRNMRFENNTILGMAMAIGTIGEGAQVIGNTIRGFSGDAIRAIGDQSLVQGNTAMDCVKVNDNHDDGIQSWSRGANGRSGGGVVQGLTLDANTIIEWTGPEDHPLRCALQGIGLFDGMFEDLTITNNVIAVSAFHGISVYGGKNVLIANNTLINAKGISRKAPWIGVYPHKNKTPSQDVIVANNIAPAYKLTPDFKERNQAIANHVVIYPARDMYLSGPESFRLKPDSALRGTADPTLAPKTDRTGQTRGRTGGASTNPGAFDGG